MNHPVPPPRPQKQYDLVESFDPHALSRTPDDTRRARSARDDADIADIFSGLTLAGHSNRINQDEGRHYNRINYSDPFVGGFNPEHRLLNAVLDANRGIQPPKPTGSRPAPPPRQNGEARVDAARPPIPSLPIPPAIIPMPEPQVQGKSRTMQHALARLPGIFLPSRRRPKPALHTNSDPALYPSPPPPNLAKADPMLPPPLLRPPPNNLNTSLSASISTTSPPNTPTRRVRSSSSPPLSGTSSLSKNTLQCSGITKQGARCKKTVKTSLYDIMADPDADVKVFCHQHRDEVAAPTGFYRRKPGEPQQWIEFGDWIPGYLHQDTQLALRTEMTKGASPSDEPGYIYTFEIRDPRDTKHIQLKVGRSVNLVKRLDQWGKQCVSKEQVLRGWWPGFIEQDDDDVDADAGFMRGRIKGGEKGPLCHRLERLVHLELADLAAYAPYLDAKFPNCESPANQGSAGTSPAKMKTPKKVPRKSCPDCGSVHREIFSFPRVETGRYKGNEWELLVLPVIEKWGGFVESYV